MLQDKETRTAMTVGASPEKLRLRETKKFYVDVLGRKYRKDTGHAVSLYGPDLDLASLKFII